MATYVTLTVPAKDIIGALFDERRTSAYIEADTPGGLIVVDSTNLRVGGRREKVGSSGTVDFPNLVATNSADNPTSFGYRITLVFTPLGAKAQQTITTSAFPLTATANLAAIEAAWDEITAPPSWRSDFLDQMEALRADVIDISGISTPDAVVEALVKGTAGAGPLTRAALADEDRRTEGVIYLENYPRTGGETDDAPRLGRALAAMATSGAKILQLGAGPYTLASATNVTLASITIRGTGKKATEIVCATDAIALNVTGNHVSIEHLMMTAGTQFRTVYPVKFTNASQGSVQHCYLNGITDAQKFGVYFSGGSMGTVSDCTFNHANIRVETWDVKIRDCYVWGMTNEFCIGIFNGAGNTTLQNVDVVPPLLSTAIGVAAILVDGVSGNSFNTKMSNIYLDGNPSLVTRMGIYIGDGSASTLMQNINANEMDADCIVIDSAYNVYLDGYSGHTNNEGGNGAREIVVKQTGAQPTEKIRLSNIQCLRTTAVTGTAGPAIEVDSAVGAWQVTIDGFDIKQPTGGGGYTLPEVKVPVTSGYPIQSMSGSGMLSIYQATGSQAVASGATSATINLGSPYPMAYRPRPSQITFTFETAGGIVTRVQYTTDNQIFVPFSTAMGAAGVIHWRADLRR